MAIFNFQPRRRDARQTSGRDLTGLLSAQRKGTEAILGEVDEYGKRKRGADIMAKLAGMTPEERATTDIMALGGSGTQSDQTMDILSKIAGKQEAEVGRDFRAGEAQKSRDFTARENEKSRIANINLAKLKGKLDEGIKLNPTEEKGLIEGLRTVDRDIALRRGQLGTAKPRDKAGILATIQDLTRQKTNMEKMLNPDYAKGVETQAYKTAVPGDYQMGKLFPIKEQKTEKKKTNIFGF